jgi:hypothetical protein
MAKKKKKEPKEVFKEPKFDEVEFMKTEVESAKTGVITILYAIPVAIISFELTVIGLAAIGFLVGIFAMFTLRFLYTKIGINLKGFEKKTWAGNAALLFFTWLLIWILLLNPPFSDLSEPSIIHVEVWVQDDNGIWAKTPLTWINGRYQAGDIPIDTIANGTNIKVKSNVTDNTGLASVRIISLGGTIGNDTAMTLNSSYTYNYEFDYNLDLVEVYSFNIRAVDKNNNVKVIEIIVPTVQKT